MSKLVDVKIPDLGSDEAVPAIEILVKDGEQIEQDQIMLVLESDKATMEVPSPASGVVRGLKVTVGQKLSTGDVICQLEQEDSEAGGARGEAETAPAPAAAPATAPAQAAAQGNEAAPPAAVAASPHTPNASRIEVAVPDLGGSEAVPIIELLVSEGSTVAKDETLMVLESDKSTMELPAPAAGVVRGLLLKVGDKVSLGTAVCTIETAAGVAADAPAASATAPAPAQAAAAAPALPAAAPAAASVAAGPDAKPPAAPPPAPATAAAPGTGAHAGPAARKFARELGVELAQVPGSGVHGRVVVEDIQAFVKARMSGGAAAAPPASPLTPHGGTGIPPIPAQDFAAFGPIETKPLARIRKLSAAHLSRAWLNVPHVTQYEEADITELEAFRKAMNAENPATKLTLLPFLLKAVAALLKTFPEFNSSLAPAGDALILKGYCNLGFAADTDAGLVVPVVKDVWSKGIAQLAKDCGDLAKKARDAKLKPDEMRGGCMSISSLGGLGVAGHFTPIVNAPEVAILGVSKATLKPVWDGKAFAPRLMLPLSLSYDHRVIDGAYAARGMVYLAGVLGDVRRLVL